MTNVMRKKQSGDKSAARTDRIVKRRIRSVAVDKRLAGVMHVILNVRKLLMRADEIVDRHLRALFDTEIDVIAKIPGGSSTFAAAVVRTLDDGIATEFG